MEVTDYLRFVAALAFVVALIVGLAWGVRRFGLVGAAAVARRSGDRRLAVVEVLPVDTKRRLLLLRRDGIEHLVMLGAERDLVIEIGVRAPAEPYAAVSQEGGVR